MIMELEGIDDIDFELLQQLIESFIDIKEGRIRRVK